MKIARALFDQWFAVLRKNMPPNKGSQSKEGEKNPRGGPGNRGRGRGRGRGGSRSNEPAADPEVIDLEPPQ